MQDSFVKCSYVLEVISRSMIVQTAKEYACTQNRIGACGFFNFGSDGGDRKYLSRSKLPLRKPRSAYPTNDYFKKV
jgi:hypothetical protein